MNHVKTRGVSNFCFSAERRVVKFDTLWKQENLNSTSDEGYFKLYSVDIENLFSNSRCFRDQVGTRNSGLVAS